MTRYLVVECPKCHRHYISTGKKVVRCPYCRRSMRVGYGFREGWILFRSEDWYSAKDFLDRVSPPAKILRFK